MTKVTQHDRYMSDGSSFFASMGKWTFGRGRLDVKQKFFFLVGEQGKNRKCKELIVNIFNTYI